MTEQVERVSGQDKSNALTASLVGTTLSSMTVFAGLILLIITFTSVSPYFLTADNIYRILQQVSVLLVAAVGQSMVIFTAGIDLSQAAVVSLCAVVGAMAMIYTESIFIGILVSITVGAFIGLVNGLLIVKGKLVPFITTLAMLGIASGTALFIRGGRPVFGLPEAFVSFGNNGWLFIPYTVMIAGVVAVAVQIMLSNTRTGRYIYAIGSNRSAARSAGIHVTRILLAVYIMCGIAAGIAAVLQVAYLDTAQPTLNINLALNVIAVVIIGGGSLFGGKGTIWGTISGALLIAVLNNGTQLLGIGTYVQTILLGVVVILAVSLDNVWNRERVSA